MRNLISFKIRNLINLCFVMLFVLILTSCNQQTTEKSETTQTKVSNSHYPVTITNYNYAKKPIEITFEKAPEKVLAIYQNSIETLLALGLEEHIIAASGLDHEVKPQWKESFSKINYLTEFAPDKESVIMIKPDFILSWYSIFGEKKLGDVDYWHNNGINTYISTNSGAISNRTLENEYNDILNIGKIFNVEDKAESLVNEIKSEIKSTVEYLSTINEKKSVLIVEFLNNSISVHGEKTLGGDMITQLGADLISPNNKIGNEDIIKLNPDVIFVVYMDRENENMADKSVKIITENPIFSSLNAVKTQSVIPIQLGEMYSSGARTIDGIITFSRGLYPKLGEENEK